jgi:hypothetical protein
MGGQGCKLQAIGGGVRRKASGPLAQAGETHLGRSARRRDTNVLTCLLSPHFRLPASGASGRPGSPRRWTVAPPRVSGTLPREAGARGTGADSIFVGKSIEHAEIVASALRPSESPLPFPPDRTRDRGRAGPAKTSPTNR